MTLITFLEKTTSELEILGFDAKFGQIRITENEIFVGIKTENKNKHYDKWNKPNYFELGQSVGAVISKTKLLELKMSAVDFEYDFVLGALCSQYSFDKYLKISDKKLFSIENNLDQKAKQKLEIMVESIAITKSVVNEIPANLYPESYCEIIQKQIPDVQIFDQKWLKEQGMEATIAVGNGSLHESMMIWATYKPKGQIKKKIVLVGKAVTFDSGGNDIKSDMKSMKSDMAGSGTCFGVFCAISKLGLEHTQIDWISTMAENVTDGKSYKSDDILSTYSGQTVEIFNTDAEGRLTLADSLSFATTLDPDFIVDVATLTGMVSFAITDQFTGLMGNDKNLVDSIESAFLGVNEKIMPIAMPESLRSHVKGVHSDLINTAKTRQAGHITAGLFLSHFVDQNLFRGQNFENLENPKQYSWAHLDVAGTAFDGKYSKSIGAAATGKNVQGLVEWILGQDLQN